ncbi:MAG: 3-deoxy-8-phosphooctulonate synthase [Mariprofundales bacterium]
MITLNKHAGSAIHIGNDLPFVLFAGPCVIEGEQFQMDVAASLQEICLRHNVSLVFKSSFDKANRTSINSYRGPGLTEGLRILARIRNELGLPIITDVHTPEQVKDVAKVADILQTPAFLCRQTDFIQTVAAAGKAVNIKKGQFLAPTDMQNVANKALATGNKAIMLCDRGTSFGYNQLVSDFRGLPIMAKTGLPIVFDATHSVQQPGGQGTSSGGESQFVATLARAACAVGVAALFMEVHPNPSLAKSDGANSINLETLDTILPSLQQIDAIIKPVNKRTS